MKNARHAKEGSSLEFKRRRPAGGSRDARASWLPRCREVPVGGGNTVRKLINREIGGLSGRTPSRPDSAFCAEKFRHFNLQEQFLDTAPRVVMPLPGRSITHIIPANDFFFVINRFGYCVAFNRTANASITPYKKNGRIWYFNNYFGLFKILFYNINDSIITVSTSILWRGYKMRAIQLESVRIFDDWGSGTPVFGSSTNDIPLFDDCNSFAIITLDQEDGHLVNNIYEMNNYELVHSIPGRIHSIATRPGIIIVSYENTRDYLPIKVFSTENWTVLKDFSYHMPPCRRMQFFELCYENILLQEHDRNMQLIDIWNNNNVTTIKRSKNQILSSSCDLHGNDVLLIFKNQMIVTCNSRGVQVPLLDASGNENDCFTFQIDVTRDNNFAILYSMKTENPAEAIYGQQDSSITSIDIRSTFNGKSILKVNPWDDPYLTTMATSNSHRTNDRQGSASEALKNVTALFYDEEHHTIYTGKANGFIHVWSN